MSSDTSVITVRAVSGNTIDLLVRTTSAGGPNDVAYTRSFALVALAEARRRAEDYNFPADKDPTPLELVAEAWAKKDADWYVSEKFMKANVGKYVKRAEVLARRNIISTTAHEELARKTQEIDARELSATDAEALYLDVCHSIDLRVELTDAKWLAGLAPGLVFGTTAYDVWWKDPARQELPFREFAPEPEGSALLVELKASVGDFVGAADRSLMLTSNMPWQLEKAPKTVREALLPIATDNWEGTYLIWKRGATAIDACPVIYVGESSKVVAGSTRELLALWRTGIVSVGRYNDEEKAREKKDVSSAFAAFCEKHEIAPAAHIGSQASALDGELARFLAPEKL